MCAEVQPHVQAYTKHSQHALFFFLFQAAAACEEIARDIAQANRSSFVAVSSLALDLGRIASVFEAAKEFKKRYDATLYCVRMP